MGLGKRSSQSDIARRLGISQRAVSKALRGEPGISDKTRELVRRTADELSYHGDRLTRCLLGGKSHIVGVLMPTFVTPFFGELLDGAETVFGRNGYRTMLSRWEKGVYSDETEINWLLQYKVDALLVFPRPALPEQRLFYKSMVDNGQRIVFVNEPPPCEGACGVYSDDRSGVFQAMGRLLELGHSRIGYARSALELSGTSVLRRDAYADAVRELGGFEPMELVVESENVNQASLKRFLKANSEATAFLCYGDALAIGLIKALGVLGRQVPRDFSVVGFGDNVRHVDFLKVPLTSVSQDARRMGAKAAELCLELVNGKPAVGDVPLRDAPCRARVDCCREKKHIGPIGAICPILLKTRKTEKGEIT